ncbi:MAG: ribosome small subunit-dependent GTPase A [Flavobacteriales bacterium]|nr:MAG: ribosome small subunit-dependent GTPase A [Flavobacteriales bacterium]
MKGHIYKSTGSWYTVKIDAGKFIECRLSGRLRVDGIKSTNPVCVGDYVLIEKRVDSYVVKKLLERKNFIIRKSVKLSKQYHIIASNIDICFLLVTPKNPVTSTMFIDRFLASTLSYGIETVIVFNKIDQYDKESMNQKNEIDNIYKKAGYKTISISALKKSNLSDLLKLMQNKVCVFSGHSGVGKSTLLNSLDDNLSIKTLPISESKKSGQHTTTFSEMYDLKKNIKVIDTPGIKGFGLYNINNNELSDYFLEFRNGPSCKFHNCIHKKEPGCVIKKEIENGNISKSRYSNYLLLLEEINNETSFR